MSTKPSAKAKKPKRKIMQLELFQNTSKITLTIFNLVVGLCLQII
jgi:hypothetical protein